MTGAILGVVQIRSNSITAKVGNVRNNTINGFNTAAKILLHAESAAHRSARINEITKLSAVRKTVNPKAAQKVFCPRQVKKLLNVSPKDGII